MGDLKIPIYHPLTWLRKIHIKSGNKKANMKTLSKREKLRRPLKPTGAIGYEERWDTKKKDCYIYKHRMKALEEKGNRSSNSDPNIKGITSQSDLNSGLDLNKVI